MNVLSTQIESLNKITAFHGFNTQKAVESLTETIKSLDEKNGKLQVALFFLTIVTICLAFIQVIGMIVQIKLQMRVPNIQVIGNSLSENN